MLFTRLVVAHPACMDAGHVIAIGSYNTVFSASRYNLFTVVELGALTPGSLYVFNMEARYYDGQSGRSSVGVASIDVEVNAPPFGGLTDVSPTSGYALVTTFSVRAQGWIDDSEDLPLRCASVANLVHFDNAACASLRVSWDFAAHAPHTFESRHCRYKFAFSPRVRTAESSSSSIDEATLASNGVSNTCA